MQPCVGLRTLEQVCREYVLPFSLLSYLVAYPKLNYINKGIDHAFDKIDFVATIAVLFVAVLIPTVFVFWLFTFFVSRHLDRRFVLLLFFVSFVLTSNIYLSFYAQRCNDDSSRSYCPRHAQQDYTS